MSEQFPVTEHPDQPEQPGPADRPEQPDQPGQPEQPGQPGQPGQADQPGQPDQTRRRDQPGWRDQRGVWLAVGGVVGLLGALYLAGWLFVGGRVPSGTQVADVDIGGLSADDAEQRLESELAERADNPIRLTWEDRTYKVNPERAGLSLNVEETVGQAGAGRSWNPVRMLDTLFGSDQIEPVVEVDRDALDAQVDKLAKRIDVPATEPSITFSGDGGREVTQPKSGLSMDRAATADAIVSSYLASGGPIELSVEETEPTVDAGELGEALDDLADPAMSGPVHLELPNRTVDLTIPEFAPALSLEVSDGELRPTFDLDRLERGIERLSKRIGVVAHDAEVVLRHGRPVVVPARPGVTLDPREVADQVAPVLSETGEARTVEVGTSVGKADFTTQEARALGIHEVVSKFTTYYPHAHYRNVNLGRAAELINGTVLKPGQTFSLNETVGERTKENGFTVGYIIDDGVYAEDYGGGVSQVATTTFNAAFFAGLKDVEHKTHSFYIDRYPVGREATVAWPYVDLKFKNTTPYGVLIQAWIVPSTPSSYGEMHVRMWSTKYWDITTSTSKRYDFTSPSTRYIQSPDCYAETGYSGFDIDVYRYFRRHGSDELVRKETMHTTYIPLDTVICGKRPEDRKQRPGGG
jgi:vancomycin resistance protein YoaR